MKRIEYLEHTADVLILAHGDNLAEAIAAAADGMFEIITGHSASGDTGVPVTIEVDGADIDSLVIRFLSELVVRHEVDRVVMSDFAVEILPDFRLRATARALPFDESRDSEGCHVKGVPYHLLEISDLDGAASVRVLFDI
jgi:SHS2 domain-containing protein